MASTVETAADTMRAELLATAVASESTAHSALDSLVGMDCDTAIVAVCDAANIAPNMHVAARVLGSSPCVAPSQNVAITTNG